MNKIYDKLKKMVDETVSPLIADREKTRTRMQELRQQVQDYRKKALSLAGELKELEKQYPVLLLDNPKDVPALQKKIEKLQSDIKNQTHNGDTLETLLPDIEQEMAKRSEAVSSAVCRIVVNELPAQSAIASDAFLNLFTVCLSWLEAVEMIRNDTKAVGLDPLCSHRLSVYKSVQKIPLQNRRYWHLFAGKIAGDFSTLGSNRGDL